MSQLDVVARKAAKFEQTRGVRYRIDLNITNAPAPEQARGLTRNRL
jgi:hypothetical protein